MENLLVLRGLSDEQKEELRAFIHFNDWDLDEVNPLELRGNNAQQIEDQESDGEIHQDVEDREVVQEPGQPYVTGTVPGFEIREK